MSSESDGFDITPLIRRVERALPDAMQYLPQIVEEQARLIVSSGGKGGAGMLQLLPPKSEGASNAQAQKHGEMRVRGDIAKVYATPGRVYQDLKENKSEAVAKAFYAGIKSSGRSAGRDRFGRYLGNNAGRKGTLEDAQRILRSSGLKDYGFADIGPFDGGQLHRSRRSSGNGRVNSKKVALVVTDPKSLSTYVDGRVSHVGMMAATFNTAGARLGCSGMPTYATRHGDQFSSFAVHHTDSAFWIVMTPRISFGMDEIQRRWAYAFEYRFNKNMAAGYLRRIQKVFVEPGRMASAA